MNDLEAVEAAASVVDVEFLRIVQRVLKEHREKTEDLKPSEISAEARRESARVFLTELNRLGFFVMDNAEIARLSQQGWAEGYEQGRNDFADENGYPDDTEFELGGES